MNSAVSTSVPLEQRKSCNSLATNKAWQNQLTLIPFHMMARRRNVNLSASLSPSLSLSTPSLISHTTLGTAMFLNSIFPEKPLALLPYCTDPSLSRLTDNVSISVSTLASGFARNTHKAVSDIRPCLKQSAEGWNETVELVMNMDSDWMMHFARH